MGCVFTQSIAGGLDGLIKVINSNIVGKLPEWRNLSCMTIDFTCTIYWYCWRIEVWGIYYMPRIEDWPYGVPFFSHPFVVWPSSLPCVIYEVNWPSINLHWNYLQHTASTAYSSPERAYISWQRVIPLNMLLATCILIRIIGAIRHMKHIQALIQFIIHYMCVQYALPQSIQ